MVEEWRGQHRLANVVQVELGREDALEHGDVEHVPTRGIIRCNRIPARCASGMLPIRLRTPMGRPRQRSYGALMQHKHPPELHNVVILRLVYALVVKEVHQVGLQERHALLRAGRVQG
jgi:hypothetical protein